MGGKGDPGHQIRLLYPVKDDATFGGMRDHMLGPAKDIAELANRYSIPYAVSSGFRAGENSAHGNGFAMDWSMPDFFAAPLLREMNNRWGPKGYFFSWHRNRMGFDDEGEPIFDEENFHFHGQLKQQRYREILDQERSGLAVDDSQRDQARRLVGEIQTREERTAATQPEGPAVALPELTGLTNFRQTPALRGSVKTQHLNLISSKVVMGPELPELKAQGLIVGQTEKTRAHEAPAIETNRILQGALRDIGRKTLIEGG